MARRGDTAAIQVANINKKQAILVAVIGGIALVASGPLLDRLVFPPASTTSHALLVKDVSLGLDSESRTEEALRVIASINGASKTYPSDGTWAPRGPDFSMDPLFQGDALEYSVRFEVFAKDQRGGITRFVSPSACSLKAHQLPARKMRLELLEEGTGGSVTGEVSFDFE
jgi:hypothetical protein